MFILNSKNEPKASSPSNGIALSAEYLQYVVESIAIPRHFSYEQKNNATVKKWIKSELDRLGLVTTYQGRYHNVIATSTAHATEYVIVVGAHYDSVPGSPGADDNASAIAGLLALAKGLQAFGDLPILYAAFNREEDGLLGSQEFVASLSAAQTKQIQCAHILEMIGYCRKEANSQQAPPGLPIAISNVGDFIGIIANRYSNKLLKPIIKTADNYVPTLPVKALEVFFGVEKYFPHLSRSDHASFWASKIPSLMWTDTSEFRNPNYHQASDTPDTLDYEFMHKVVQLLGNCILAQLGKLE